MVGGRPRYTGLVQCFTAVWAVEGWRGLYGSLTPHLVRVHPLRRHHFGRVRVCFEAGEVVDDRPEHSVGRRRFRSRAVRL